MNSEGSNRRNGVEGAGPSAGAKRKRASIPLEQLKISRPSHLSNRLANSDGDSNEIFHSSFWDEEVSGFLNDSIRASQRLSNVMKQGGNRVTYTEDSKDPILVMNGLRLISYQCWRHCQSNQINPIAISSCMGVVKVLVASVKCCCDRLIKRQKEGLSDSDLFLAKVVINCGIYLNFTLKPFITTFDSDDKDFLLRSLDAFASLGVLLASSKFAPENESVSFVASRPCCCASFSCALNCLGLSLSNEVKASKDDFRSSCPLCLCSLVSDVRSVSDTKFGLDKSDKPFALDCSIFVFDLLPIRSR